MAKTVADLSFPTIKKKQDGEIQFTVLFVVRLCVKAAISDWCDRRFDIYASGLYKPRQFPLGSRNIAKDPLPPGIKVERQLNQITGTLNNIDKNLSKIATHLEQIDKTDKTDEG